MKEKALSNSLGTFVMRRHDVSCHFVCDNCLEPKTARIEVEWHKAATGRIKILCNGCYGRLIGSLEA